MSEARSLTPAERGVDTEADEVRYLTLKSVMMMLLVMVMKRLELWSSWSKIFLRTVHQRCRRSVATSLTLRPTMTLILV